MKRFINLIVTAAMILSVTAAAIPASAYEAATVEEHNAYYKEITVFPDPAERSFEYKKIISLSMFTAILLSLLITATEM